MEKWRNCEKRTGGERIEKGEESEKRGEKSRKERKM